MRAAIFLLGLLAVLPVCADIPNTIPHQGRVSVGSTNFDGIGQFKFLLFGDEDGDHNSGNEVAIWSNSSTTPANMSEPLTAINLVVTKGLYSVWLGDADIAGMAALPATFDPSDKQLYLRLWFDDGINGSQRLNPDQKITSVPYALLAATADFASAAGTAQSVQAGSIGSAQIANGAIQAIDLADDAVTTAKLADEAVTQTKLAPGAATGLARPGDSGDQRLAVQESGQVVIGNSAATAVPAPVLVPLDSDGTNLDTPTDLAVQGDFVYIIDSNQDVLQIFNVADPENIVPEDSDGTNLSVPISLAVEGDFVYVVDSGTDLLQVFNVSNPSSITALGSIATGSSPVDVAVQNKIVYVVDNVTDTLQIFDATDPNAIVAKAATDANLDAPTALFVEGDFAYVVDDISERLQIFDVSDVDNIVVKDFDQTNMSAPRDIAVVGNYAYVVFGDGFSSAGLQIFDVSDTASITALDSDATFLSFPSRIAIEGGTAFVSETNTRLAVFDVSDPGEIVPRFVDSTTMNAPRSLAVAGEFAFAGDSNPGRIQAFRIAPAAGVVGDFSVIGQSYFDSVTLSGPLAFSDGTSLASAPKLNLLGNILSITDGNSVNLGAFSQFPILSGDILKLTGNPTMVSLGQYLRDDGSEPVTGSLTVNGTVAATGHKFPSAQTFTYQIPGNTMIPNSDNRDYSASSTGYVVQVGTDIQSFFNAPLHLPEGATISTVTALLFDNTANNFGTCKARLRRRAFDSSSNENIAALDFTPSGTADTSIKTVDIPVSGASPTIENDTYQYWVHVELNASPTDSNLRFYGFRIQYTLETLKP